MVSRRLEDQVVRSLTGVREKQQSGLQAQGAEGRHMVSRRLEDQVVRPLTGVREKQQSGLQAQEGDRRHLVISRPQVGHLLMGSQRADRLSMQVNRQAAPRMPPSLLPVLLAFPRPRGIRLHHLRPLEEQQM
jgi:hypothetical protein